MFPRLQRFTARLAANKGVLSAAAASQQRWVSLSAGKKKIWDFEAFTADHRTVLFQLPSILGSYVGPNAIEPQLNESIMVTMNSVNGCPYCTAEQLALVIYTDVVNRYSPSLASSDAESRKVVDEPAITYARIFAEADGRGDKEATAYSTIVKHYGEGEANSIRALCWFLKWGSIGGNTLNANFLDWKDRPLGPYNLFYTVYYGPLFAVIAGLNAVLKRTPELPKAVSSSIGVVLTVAAGAWIAPVGVASTFYLSP
eukprot:gene22373-26150_t